MILANSFEVIVTRDTDGKIPSGGEKIFVHRRIIRLCA
jgi:hypothetical protein